MEFHLENSDCLNRESHVTLTFIILAVSSSFAGAVLGIRLTRYCLWAENVMAPSNEPKNLQLSLGTYALEEIREVELENLQARIEFNQARNARTGEHLNRSRLKICATPAVFLIGVLAIAIIGRVSGYQWF